MSSPITPETKKAVAMALRGIARSPTWELSFFHDYRDAILSLLFYDSRALLSAKRDYRPSFIEHILNFCSDKELVELFLDVPLFKETDVESVFREAYRSICLYTLGNRWNNRETNEQFSFAQEILKKARRDEQEQAFILVTTLLKHATWWPTTHTGQLLCWRLDSSQYDIRLLNEVLQEQIQIVLSRK